MTVNHVGFTQEVGELLNSNRNLETIYDFVKAAKGFSDFNTFVYNFLGRIFSKRINEESEEEYYKLTKAVARQLTIGFLDGIMYPTVAMSANAENIVLKPKLLDKLRKRAKEYPENSKLAEVLGRWDDFQNGHLAESGIYDMIWSRIKFELYEKTVDLFNTLSNLTSDLPNPISLFAIKVSELVKI